MSPNDTLRADRIARIRGTKTATKTTENRAEPVALTTPVRAPKPTRKRTTFAGLCCLCGMPAKRRYCHAHSWAEGT